MGQDIVSVIMPIYRTTEVRLRKSIESIITQTYKRIEIVLVDDGSPDKCGEICDAFATIDNRIQVIHKINNGVSSARNRGLEAATGNYILFVDSDDILNSDAIEILIKVAQSTMADITICSCKHVNESINQALDYSYEKIQLKTVDSSDAIKNLSYNVQVFKELEPTAVWGKLYRKNILQNLHFNEEMSMGEDFVFNYFANYRAKKVTYCNLKLYNYNFIETSLTHNKIYSPKLMQSFDQLINFEKRQRSSKYSDDLISRCVNIAFTIYLKIPEEQYEECKKIENYICEHRTSVLKNMLTTKKVKVAIILSYIGFKTVRLVFDRVNKQKVV